MSHSKALAETPPNSASGVCGATETSSSATCPEPAYLQGFPGSPANEIAKRRCRPRILLPYRTHVRLIEKTTADQRRRPTDRLRNPRRVRPRARWEASPGLRRPCPGISSPRNRPDGTAPRRFVQPAFGSRLPQAAPRIVAVARRSKSKRCAASAGRGVAAPREPRDRGSARRLWSAAARANSWRGLLTEEPAATYSPRRFPPKYHRR